MQDDGFIDRAQLWAALWNVIPQDAEANARRYVCALEQAYWELVCQVQEERDRIDADLHACREQLADAQRQLAELATSTLTITHEPMQTH
jgi:hypothetical protein